MLHEQEQTKHMQTAHTTATGAWIIVSAYHALVLLSGSLIDIQRFTKQVMIMYHVNASLNRDGMSSAS